MEQRIRDWNEKLVAEIEKRLNWMESVKKVRVDFEDYAGTGKDFEEIATAAGLKLKNDGYGNYIATK